MEQDQEELKIKQQIQVLDKVKKTMYSRINEFNKEEQELIKHLDNLEQQKKENYKNHLEGFETHTQLRIKETPLLLALFNEFVQEIYRPSKMYKLAAKTKNIINDELLKTLNEEQKNLLEQWQYCEDRILDNMVEQAFSKTNYKFKIIPCNYEQNIEKIKQYHKSYYIRNKDKIRKYHQEYNKKNRTEKNENTKKQEEDTNNKVDKKEDKSKNIDTKTKNFKFYREKK